MLEAARRSFVLSKIVVGATCPAEAALVDVPVQPSRSRQRISFLRTDGDAQDALRDSRHRSLHFNVTAAGFRSTPPFV
jgi:hypothetical protein